MKSEKRNTLTSVLFAIYLLALTRIILFKLPFYSGNVDLVREINMIPLLGSFDDNGVIRWGEIIGNILVFIPFGIYLCMLKRKWSYAKKILPITGLSLSFEVIQFIFAIGRTDITDILGNTLGGIIGIGIYASLYKVFKTRTDKAINMVAGFLTVCVLLLFAFLLFIKPQARI